MVAAEFKTVVSTVRIHDDYCEMTAEHCISHLSRIVSASYKRRRLSNRGEGNPSVIAAANITEKVLKL